MMESSISVAMKSVPIVIVKCITVGAMQGQFIPISPLRCNFQAVKPCYFPLLNNKFHTRGACYGTAENRVLRRRTRVANQTHVFALSMLTIRRHTRHLGVSSGWAEAFIALQSRNDLIQCWEICWNHVFQHHHSSCFETLLQSHSEIPLVFWIARA